jgi:ankyrin repeat protein
VKLVLALGADVNAEVIEATTSTTSLREATRPSNGAELIRFLIAHGANVNACSGPAPLETPLQVAAFEGNVAAVKELLKAGANVNLAWCSSHSLTPNQAATRHGSVGVVRMLVEAGADVNAGEIHIEDRFPGSHSAL